LCIDVQRAIADERSGDDRDQRLAHRHQQMRAVGGHAAVILLGQHLAAMNDDPAVSCGGRHHIPDGGAPAVGLVVQRDVRQLSLGITEFGDGPCAARDDRRREEVGHVLERPMQLRGGLPVVQRHVRRHASGITA
jgi:hypothetical protein